VTKGARALSYEMLDALTGSGLSGTAVCVALAIGRLQGNGESAWPGLEHLAGKVKASERQVQRAIKDLVSSGFLTVRKHPGKLDVYSLHTPDISVASQDDESVTGDTSVTPDKNVASTPDIFVARPPTFLSSTPDISVISHLSLDNDQGQRSMTALRESAGPELTPSEAEKPLGRVLGGFRERWSRKTGSTWRAQSKHIDRAVEVAADFADKPEQLVAALDAFFATDDAFVLKSRWAFGTWLNDPRRWLDGTPSIGRVKPATHRADVATQITDDMFVRKEAARV